MKIAILYICTGKYSVFFPDFYASSERYFLPEAEKTYIVFSDDRSLADYPKVEFHYQECRGFPADSLFRFDAFLTVRDRILEHDYAYFFNSNMLFVAPVGREFLPTGDRLTAVPHAYLLRRWPCVLPYERNRKSRAYVPPYEGDYHYFMGGLNGGDSRAFVAFAEECSRRIHEDYDNGIVAVFHDESHLNRYMRDIGGEALSPVYGYPEDSGLPLEAKILIRDKTKVDPYFRKDSKAYTLPQKFLKGCRMAWGVVRWYLKF